MHLLTAVYQPSDGRMGEKWYCTDVLWACNIVKPKKYRIAKWLIMRHSSVIFVNVNISSPYRIGFAKQDTAVKTGFSVLEKPQTSFRFRFWDRQLDN